MRRVEKPWGFEIIWAETDDYVGKLLHINAGHRLSKQYHEIKEETLYVLKGILINYDKDDKPMRIPPGELESSVEVIEVSTPHLNDVVRLEDDY